MHVPFLDLKAQYKQIESEVVPAVTEAMAAGMFIGGPQVSGFEEEFAAILRQQILHRRRLRHGRPPLRPHGGWRRPGGHGHYGPQHLHRDH